MRVDLGEGHPYVATVEKTTGVSVIDAYVDKGCRGHDDPGKDSVPSTGSSSRNLTGTKKKRRRAVEPNSYLKSANRMRRCFLKGLTGDSINAVLAAADCSAHSPTDCNRDTGTQSNDLANRLFLERLFNSG